MPDSPSVKQALAGANIIVNLSCSDEIAGKAEYRRNLVKMQSAKLICGCLDKGVAARALFPALRSARRRSASRTESRDVAADISAAEEGA